MILVVISVTTATGVSQQHENAATSLRYLRGGSYSRGGGGSGGRSSARRSGGSTSSYSYSNYASSSYYNSNNNNYNGCNTYDSGGRRYCADNYYGQPYNEQQQHGNGDGDSTNNVNGKNVSALLLIGFFATFCLMVHFLVLGYDPPSPSSNENNGSIGHHHDDPYSTDPTAGSSSAPYVQGP